METGNIESFLRDVRYCRLLKSFFYPISVSHLPHVLPASITNLFNNPVSALTNETNIINLLTLNYRNERYYTRSAQTLTQLPSIIQQSHQYPLAVLYQQNPQLPAVPETDELMIMQEMCASFHIPLVMRASTVGNIACLRTASTQNMVRVPNADERITMRERWDVARSSQNPFPEIQDHMKALGIGMYFL
ncbi:MAG: hypothetical protein ACOCXT_05055 [Candidatus Dojkabacteria bacterium]